MIESMIAKRYARALLDLASENSKSQIDRYAEQLSHFHETCRQNRDLLPTLANSHFDIGARERITIQVAKKLSLDEHILNFLRLLIRKGRMGLLPFVLAEYIKLANEAIGRVALTVVSAIELSDHYCKKLVDHFQRESGCEIILCKKTDATLLGGIRVHLGDKVYDDSISGQLDRLKQRLAA